MLPRCECVQKPDVLDVQTVTKIFGPQVKGEAYLKFCKFERSLFAPSKRRASLASQQLPRVHSERGLSAREFIGKLREQPKRDLHLFELVKGCYGHTEILPSAQSTNELRLQPGLLRCSEKSCLV